MVSCTRPGVARVSAARQGASRLGAAKLGCPSNPQVLTGFGDCEIIDARHARRSHGTGALRACSAGIRRASPCLDHARLGRQVIERRRPPTFAGGPHRSAILPCAPSAGTRAWSLSASDALCCDVDARCPRLVRAVQAGARGRIPGHRHGDRLDNAAEGRLGGSKRRNPAAKRWQRTTGRPRREPDPG